MAYKVTAFVIINGEFHVLEEQETTLKRAETLAKTWLQNPISVPVDGATRWAYGPAAVSHVDIEEIVP